MYEKSVPSKKAATASGESELQTSVSKEGMPIIAFLTHPPTRYNFAPFFLKSLASFIRFAFMDIFIFITIS